MQLLPLADGQTPMMEAATPAPRRRRTWYVILALFFFAAIIPETILTTSTPVVELLANPLDLFLLMLFYGTADLLIREALIRRRLGWVSLVLFGIAFGFFNEGVIAGTWYTMKPDGYIFFGLIDYAWVASLTVFHIFLSVITPIAFIETVFPSRAGLPLLRRRGIVISAIVFLLLTSLFLFTASYRPYRIAVFVIALVIAAFALRLAPARPRQLPPRRAPGLWRLRGAGFCAMLSYFLLIYIAPSITVKLVGGRYAFAQFVDIALCVLYSALLLRIGRGWTAHAGWSLRHTLALITGIMAFSTLISLLIPEFWSDLEFLATVPFFILLIALSIRLRRRERARAIPATTLE